MEKLQAGDVLTRGLVLHLYPNGEVDYCTIVVPLDWEPGNYGSHGTRYNGLTIALARYSDMVVGIRHKAGISRPILAPISTEILRKWRWNNHKWEATE